MALSLALNCVVVLIALVLSQHLDRTSAASLWDQASVWSRLQSLNRVDLDSAVKSEVSVGSLDGRQVSYNPFSACERALGGSNVAVIMVADPGTFTGVPENKHYVANLQKMVVMNANDTVCASKIQGQLMGQRVLVVTSGIGPVAAALCAMELLACAKHIKEIFYVGTSGWSPQPGGVLSTVLYQDSQSAAQEAEVAGRQLLTDAEAPADVAEGRLGDDLPCHTANPSTVVNRIGDVCISAFTVNGMCKKADFNEVCSGYGNLCSLPGEVAGPDAGYLFGQCEYTTSSPGTLALAQELLQAAAGATNPMPTRNDAVRDWEVAYWASMQQGTGVAYQYDDQASPSVLDHTQCVEVDGQFFYTGPPFEMEARQYAAQALVEGLGVQLDMTQVTAAAAEEGVGLSEAVSKFNALDGVRELAYINVRSMSNHLHQPVARDLLRHHHWHYGTQVSDDYVNGYKYAIATSSTLLLNLFKLRCLSGWAGHCDFYVEYP